MNILYIVPYIPSPIHVRPYNLIRNLTERGHCVTVATVYVNEHERSELEALRPYCYAIEPFLLPRSHSLLNSVGALTSSMPLQAVYAWSAEFAKAITTMVATAKDRLPPTPQGSGDDGISLTRAAGFDIIHVEHMRGANYGLHLKNQLGPACPPVIWDCVDCLSLLLRQSVASSKNILKRLTTHLELERTEYYEGWLATRFNHVLVTSSSDQKALAPLMPPGSPISAISVLPNGVDLDYFQPSNEIQRDPDALVITGKMSYHANINMALHMVQNIMPIVWARRPNTRVYIAGKDPPREILALGQNPSVIVTGTVEDIRPYLLKSSISVAPITYGAGIQNKVLEAMACGTPVISTPQAISALRVIPGRDVVVAQEPIAFAEAVLDLLRKPERQHQIGAAGRAYVEAHHQWPEITAQLDGVYRNVISALAITRRLNP